MKHINILVYSQLRDLPEWDKNKYPESEYDIRFNSTENIIWDCVVVRQNVSKPFSFRCKSGNVIYLNCEPPIMAPLPHSFTNQFDMVVVQNPRVKHSNKIEHHGFESWTIGRDFSTFSNRYTYEDLQHLHPKKYKNISVITSNKVLTPGHLKRVEVLKKLLDDFPGQIDMFGKGFNYVDVKADALIPYRFHICIENAFIPNCLTEKFSDPVLAETVPIYSGCPNVSDYFGDKGYIKFDIDNYEALKTIIQKIIDDPEGLYNKYITDLREVKKTLMEKESIVAFIVGFLNTHMNTDFKEYTIVPLEQSPGFKFNMLRIRIQRLIFKLFYRYFRKK